VRHQAEWATDPRASSMVDGTFSPSSLSVSTTPSSLSSTAAAAVGSMHLTRSCLQHTHTDFHRRNIAPGKLRLLRSEAVCASHDRECEGT
jgi:hypothetical protein